MDTRSTLLLSAVASAVLFSVGFALLIFIPGGGTVSEADFTSFYVEGDNGFVALLLLIALVAGAASVTWFFAELRSRLPDGALTRVGFAVAVLGAGAVATGGAIMMGPLGVQMNSGGEFVGQSIAQALAQSGLFTALLVGMYSLAIAVGLFSLAMRRAAYLPSALAIAGLVVAVLMVGSFVLVPGYLLPIWVLVVGIVGARARVSATATAAA